MAWYRGLAGSGMCVVLGVGCHIIGGAGDLEYTEPRAAGGGGGGGTVVTSTSTEGAGAAGGAGGSGGAPAETQCENRQDDDGDQLIDCDDPDCVDAGFACEEVPGGTLVYVFPTMAGCPAGTTATTFSQCSAEDCTCTVSGLPTCGVALDVWQGAGCVGAPDDSENALANCASFSQTAGSARRRLEPDLASFSCGASPANVGASDRTVCALPDAPCGDAGSQCLGAEPSCVLVDGVACPAPFDAYEEEVFDGGVSQCACDCTPNDVSCSITVNPTVLYENVTCGLGQNNAGCQDGPWARYTISLDEVGGTGQCAASVDPGVTVQRLCCNALPPS